MTALDSRYSVSLLDRFQVVVKDSEAARKAPEPSRSAVLNPLDRLVWRDLPKPKNRRRTATPKRCSGPSNSRRGTQPDASFGLIRSISLLDRLQYKARQQRALHKEPPERTEHDGRR